MSEAEPICLRSLLISEEYFGPNNPKIINSLRRLSSLREKQGNKEEAISLLLRGVNILEEGDSVSSSHYVVVNIDLVELYMRLVELCTNYSILYFTQSVTCILYPSGPHRQRSRPGQVLLHSSLISRPIEQRGAQPSRRFLHPGRSIQGQEGVQGGAELLRGGAGHTVEAIGEGSYYCRAGDGC
jgi:hypothetical protein